MKSSRNQFKLLAILSALVVCISFAPLRLSGQAPKVEIDQIRIRFAELHAEEVDEFIAEKNAELEKRFLQVIEHELEKATEAGNLDDAADLTRERDHIANGEGERIETPAGPTLKRLRRVFAENQRRIDGERLQQLQKLVDAFSKELKALETSLTKQKKIQEALAVREVRREIEANPEFVTSKVAEADSEPAPAATAPMPVPRPEQEPTKIPTLPLPIPELPELPTAGGRIVVIELAVGNKPGRRAFEAIGRDDFKDVVAFGSEMLLPGAVAIRSNGSAIRWNQQGTRFETGPETAVMATTTGGDVELIAVSRTGNVSTAGGGNHSAAELLGMIEDARLVTSTGGVAWVLQADGSSSFHGVHTDKPNIRLLNEEPDLRYVKWAGYGYSGSLTKDGVFKWIVQGKIDVEAKEAVRVFHTTALVQFADGNLLNHGKTNDSQLGQLFSEEDSIPSDHVATVRGTAFKRDSGWEIWTGMRLGEWSRNEPLESAFEDAIRVELWGRHPDGAFAFAIMPPESVSRSGLWTLEDLLAEKEQKD
ncbi:MAG: hypothetical protein AAF585_01195 [Verrucomicrobiota bacterium]